jgi:alkylation response protein AidB-like acyl-CoA dehydrogenase
MNFDFSEEQNMLRDSVSRFVLDNYDFATRNEVVDSEHGYSASNWNTFAELGWLSVPFSEEVGGFGGNAVDTMVVMEQMGKGLVAEPFVATVLLFGGLIEKAGSAEQREAILPGVIAGETQGAFAYLERQSRYDLADVTTRAESSGDGYTLSGSKALVFNGMAAQTLIVAARTSGEQYDNDGISLFLVDAAADGVKRTGFRLMDGQLVANIEFDGVSVGADALLGAADAALPAMQSVVDDVTLALCAEALGIMEKLNTTTVEYAKTRQQFGVAIGSFQALQHRMVDTFMAYEQTKSMLYRTVCSLEAKADDASRNLHALKVLVARYGKQVGDEAIQIHGGMGLTDELDIGHYVKRLMTINTLFGDGAFHQARFNELAYN